jgi:acyl-CoA hydrolase
MSIVDKVIAKVGKKLVIGAPLGAGKPNVLLNTFYNRAKADSSIELIIYSALTLQKPQGKSDLEKRFMGPFAERLFGDYPDLDYELDRVKGKIPKNIKVVEFYFPAGKFYGNSYAQRNYLSSNYTHVARDIIDLGINVLLQQVSPSSDGETYSLSCNADISLDVLKGMQKREREENIPFAFVAQVNKNLPFMYGDAVVDEVTFDFIEDTPEGHYKVFGTPKMSISDADHMIGLYSSTLVKDDGELQVGIGTLGDSLTYNLLVRQKNNRLYNEFLRDLDIEKKYSPIIDKIGERGEFKIGLFAATEMMVDGFLHLFKHGILKRKVYDDIKIQRLINEGILKEDIPKGILQVFYKKGMIDNPLTEKDVNYLKEFGIFKESITYKNGKLYLHDGTELNPDFNDEFFFENAEGLCLGDKLKGGQVIHGGFFLGPNSFYEELRNMPIEELKLINMKSVTKINQLFGHEEIDRLHRKNARFINTCMKVTLSGAMVSDALQNGQVISGVGGQYNFVAMAHELEGGRSIILLRSTRSKKGKVESNIVWNYGHITIPRHLRDIIITEYGIADLRAKTDEEIIQELLKITDSRFQEELLNIAKKAGKISPKYKIPEIYKNNYPHVYEQKLKNFKNDDHFPAFPFGNDFTPEELKIGKALKWLKKQMDNKLSSLTLILKALKPRSFSSTQEVLLKRMDLLSPKNFKERLYKNLVLIGLEKTA